MARHRRDQRRAAGCNQYIFGGVFLIAHFHVYESSSRAQPLMMFTPALFSNCT